MTLLPDLERAVVDAAERHDEHAAARLSAGPSARRPARRRRRIAVIGGGAVLAVALAAAVMPSGPDRRLSVVAAAQAALTPRGDVLHLDLRIRYRLLMDGRPVRSVGQAALTQRVEQWSTEQPRRYRTVVHESKERSRWGSPPPPLQPRVETAWADGAQTHYNAQFPSWVTVTGFSPRSAASRQLALPGADASLDDLRAALLRGRLVDRGVVASAEGRVRRLTGAMRDAGSTRVTYDVDPVTFVPRHITFRTTFRLPGRHGRQGRRAQQVLDAKVVRYARLPLSPASERLLQIRPPAGTRHIVETVERARARAHARAAEEERRGRARARAERARR